VEHTAKTSVFLTWVAYMHIAAYIYKD